MSTTVKSKKTKEESVANRLESKKLNGELLNEVMKIIDLAEGLARSAETVESVADFKSLLNEYVEQRTEAMRRIEEMAQKNLRRLTGDVLTICDVVLARLPASLKTRQLFAMGLAVREVQGQSVYKRQVVEEVKTDIGEGNGDVMENNTVLSG
jgi:uncharacterized protein YaaR (DUF327 family)